MDELTPDTVLVILLDWMKKKELEQKLLIEFTREVSRLLGVLALAEQNIVLLHDDRKVTTSLQDLESMSSSSLFRYNFSQSMFCYAIFYNYHRL